MKLRAYIAALHAALFAILVGVSPAGSGSLSLLGVGKPSAAAPAYTGPGDVAGWSGAYGYWGLRAYNASLIGNNLIKVCSNSSGACAGAATLISPAGGQLASSTVLAIGYSPVYVDILYDQIGSQHLTYTGASGGIRPVLTPSMVGGLPAMQFDGGANGTMLNSVSSAAALSQSLTVAGVLRFNTFAGAGVSFTDGSFAFDPLVTVGSGGITQVFGGSNASYTGVADNSFASLISVANSSVTNLSSMSVNGTITTAASLGIDPGSNGISGSNKLTMGAGTDTGGGFFLGYSFEIIVKAGAVSTTNQGLLTANQRAIGTGF